MTRKHFNALAAILRTARLQRHSTPEAAIDAIERGLVSLCYESNPSFSAYRFTSASNPEKEDLS